MTYETAPATESLGLKDLLETLWNLEDLHRQLIKEVHRYVKLKQGEFGHPISSEDLAGLL